MKSQNISDNITKNYSSPSESFWLLSSASGYWDVKGYFSLRESKGVGNSRQRVVSTFKVSNRLVQ